MGLWEKERLLRQWMDTDGEWQRTSIQGVAEKVLTLKECDKLCDLESVSRVSVVYASPGVAATKWHHDPHSDGSTWTSRIFYHITPGSVKWQGTGPLIECCSNTLLGLPAVVLTPPCSQHRSVTSEDERLFIRFNCTGPLKTVFAELFSMLKDEVTYSRPLEALKQLVPGDMEGVPVKRQRFGRIAKPLTSRRRAHLKRVLKQAGFKKGFDPRRVHSNHVTPGFTRRLCSKKALTKLRKILTEKHYARLPEQQWFKRVPQKYVCADGKRHSMLKCLKCRNSKAMCTNAWPRHIKSEKHKQAKGMQ